MADIEIIKGADNGNPPDTLRQMYPKVNRNFQRLNSEVEANKTEADNKLEAHKNSTSAHAAQNITYSGDIIGASNVKQALDNTKQTIDDLILGSGDSGPEVAAARGGHATLGDRLDASDARISEMAINVKTFGARGDGITDDTNSILEAIEASPEGGIIYFPSGEYVSSKLTIQKPLKILGAGCGSTSIVSESLTDDLFNVSSHYVSIQDIELENRNNGTGTAGAAIKLDSNAMKCTFQGLIISGFYDGINIESGVVWTIERCYIANNKRYGVYIRNVINGDTGDGTITKCTFDSDLETISAIRHESGGGLKMSLNKILSHYYGYDLQVEDGVNTSVLIINGNSIEGQKYSHIRMGRKGTTGNYSSIAISGNQHAGGVPLGLSGYDIKSAGISLVAINGNVLNGAAGSAAITLDSGLKDVMISGNVFGTWDYAVIMNAGSQRVRIGSNELANILVSPYPNSGTNNKVETTAQAGSTSGTTSSTANYGSFYSTSITVSFPLAFKNIPRVVASVKGSNGCLGVSTSEPTNTGVILFAFGLNPNTVIDVDWIAEGVL